MIDKPTDPHSANVDDDERTNRFSRRQVLIMAAAAGASAFLPSRPSQAFIGGSTTVVPGIYVWSESFFPGDPLTLYFPKVWTNHNAVSISIKIRGDPAGAELYTGPNPVFPDQGTIADDAFATGCDLFSGAVTWTVPTTAKSDLYTVTVTDQSGEIARTGFVVKGSKTTPSSAKVAVVVPMATMQAYNLWGGASLYAVDATTLPSDTYLHSWDDINFSHQVTFDRPLLGGGDLSDLYGPIVFFESALGASNIEYLSTFDLHSDPYHLLSRYNLLILPGHHEYWSKEMRNNVDLFVSGGGNVCYLGGNTCWWQVRFEGAHPTRTMVCYKMDVTFSDGSSGSAYNYTGKDPSYATATSTTHWYVRQVSGVAGGPNRPENSTTGMSYRNGAYVPGAPIAVGYKVRFPQHWAFAGTGLSEGAEFGADAGELFSDTQASERDAAHYEEQLFASHSPSATLPVPSGKDGSPLNLLLLATQQLPVAQRPFHSAWGSLDDSESGYAHATMGVFRNTGVVFNVGVLGWHYHLFSDADDPHTIFRTITLNVLSRLKNRGPFQVPIQKSHFETWVGGLPDGWIVEGPRTTTANPGGGIVVPGTGGQQWITQNYNEYGLLYLEKYTNYTISVDVTASAVGGVSINLVGPNSTIISKANISTSFETITVTGMSTNALDPPFIPARIVLVVNAGVSATLNNVTCYETATPALFRSGNPIV